MGSLVSLVMTDIVGSTRRWNMAEGAMAADLETHDRLVAEVVAVAGGRVFKHTGDGMIAVFDDPVAAVSAAAGVQRAVGDTSWLQADGLQVRAAVHSGVVYERDGDMFGTAVNKVARILSVCPPGGVLVSGATTALLTDRAPEGLALQPIGPVPLAGFATADDAHALVGAGLTLVGRVSVAAEGRIRGGQLPPIEAELVGRADELAAIWDAVGRSSLVTLVGVGGMGKTRLALEVAAGAVAAFEGAVWWIDLANATSADAVVPVAMAAIEAREMPGRTALQSFTDRFGAMTGLVVVDNCEHVLGAARELVTAMANECRALKVVCTSREALGLRREHIVPVGSLPTGEGETLFIERALAVRPDLDATVNRDVIERICTRLDGIPLAIELAAARCRSISPAEIDARLDDRFRLLRGGRDGAERHRTLQAAVAWSYSLLDADERLVFDNMAVFAGGTLIDGLTAVTGLDEFDVIDIVDRLVARSMVVASTTQLGTRYHQLETLRQYAEDRLVEAGIIGDVRDRHLTWMQQLAGWIGSCEGTPQAGDAFRRFCVEVDNLRVAVAHAAAAGRHHSTHEIVSAVATAARFRPVFEVFDWVRPIELDGDWTDAAAECAASGAVSDFLRGGESSQRLGLSVGAPERFLDTNPTVGLAHVFMQAVYAGGWPVALEQLDQLASSVDLPFVPAEIHWLWIQNMRQINSTDPTPLAPDDFDEIRRRGYSAVEVARSTGDELLSGRLLVCLAFALEHSHPREAMGLAVEAMDVFDRLGTAYFREITNALSFRCISQMSDHAEASSVSTVRALRTAIVDALDAYLGTSTILAMSAFRWIGEVDPDAAYELVAVDRRTRGTDISGWLPRFGIPLPDDWTEWEQRAQRLSLREAVEGVVAALDAAIAVAEAESAVGGES
jgi:predicted ATPase/class 3 adenylate cyclase